MVSCFFFFNDTATTEIYTLSLHDALPISRTPDIISDNLDRVAASADQILEVLNKEAGLIDRKSTRLNSSHGYISYAVFCLKKKKTDVHSASSIVYRPQKYHPDQLAASQPL